MISGDIYVVYEKRKGWTVMVAEGKDISTHGNKYREAIRIGKKKQEKHVSCG